MGLEITKFRAVDKNTLRGFLSVRMGNMGLEIRDIAVHEKNGSRWLQMPSRPYTDNQGATKYAFILDWFDTDKKAQFEAEVFRLMKEGGHGKPN
jgi:hypothetical protein